MKTTLQILGIAIAIAAIAWIGAQLLGGGQRPEPPRPADTEPAARGTEARTEVGDADTPDGVETPAAAATTERVDVSTGSGADLPQGVLGRVVDARGQPVPAADVFLMESAAPDIYSQMMLAHNRVTLPPVAITTSDAQGRFSLGVRRPRADKNYEVRAIHDRLADVTIPGIRIADGLWFDAGDVRMPDGAVVHGRVTVAGGPGLPIAGATVHASTLQGVSGLNPTPGREHGIQATTDANGNFRFENVTPGIVSLSAVAPAFAKASEPHVPVTGETVVRHDFALAQGKAISGVVTDPAGTPIARAYVTATSISAHEIVAEEALTDPDGRFEILGLIDGPYVLAADATGYVRAELKPVNAGATEQQIVLDRKCVARLRVTTKAGRQVRSYHLSIKRYFEGQEQFGAVYGSPNVQVSPRDLDGEDAYEMAGLDPGGYVFEVLAEGFAKTFSEPFAVSVGIEPPVVEVVLDEGGRLTGGVVGPDGAPLEGVTVQTLPDFFDENPLARIFGPMVPAKITQTTVRTDAAGRFSLERLAPGSYQLKFTHPEFCTAHIKGNLVEEGQRTDVPTFRMQIGTSISGIVDIDGAPGAQVRVSVTSMPNAANDGQQMINAEAITDGSGRYAITKRLPPGRYTANATRQTLGNPLLQVIDSAKTQRGFDLAAGQTTFTLNFSISSKAN